MKILWLFFIGLNFFSLENQNVAASKKQISFSLAHSVCQQRQIFSQSKILQEAVKTRPEKYSPGKSETNEDFPCGWFSVSSSSTEIKYKSCGEIDLNQNSRIVGGEDAKPNQFPSLAELVKNNGDHYCGGVILSEKWILTAAHCLEKEGDAPPVTAIVAGEHERNKDEGTEQVRQVEKLFRHPNASNYKGEDVGLIKLKEPLEFNDVVSPVTLPTKETIPEGMGQICGWGTVKNPGKGNDDAKTPPVDDNGLALVLQTSPIPIFLPKECEKYMNDSGYPGTVIYETEFCAAFKDKEINVCDGDSGGPLYDLVSTPGKQIVLGVVSNKPDVNRCAGPGIPAIFTSIPPFIDWIQKTIEENS